MKDSNKQDAAFGCKNQDIAACSCRCALLWLNVEATDPRCAVISLPKKETRARLGRWKGEGQPGHIMC